MEILFKQFIGETPKTEGEFITNHGILIFNEEQEWKDKSGFKYRDIEWFLIQVTPIKNKNDGKT